MIRVKDKGGTEVVVGREAWLVAGLTKTRIMKMS